MCVCDVDVLCQLAENIRYIKRVAERLPSADPLLMPSHCAMNSFFISRTASCSVRLFRAPASTSTSLHSMKGQSQSARNVVYQLLVQSKTLRSKLDDNTFR